MVDVPAGWYLDANQLGIERYWDGSKWTDQTRQAIAPPPPEQEIPAPTATPPPGEANSGATGSVPTENVMPSQTIPGKTPPMVIWAFILSILGICGVTAIVALVLGFIGRGKAKSAGSGVGLATAAIVISIVWLVLLAFGSIRGVGSNTTQGSPSPTISSLGPSDAASGLPNPSSAGVDSAPSVAPSPSLTYQDLLAGKPLTTPEICKQYESDLAAFSDKTSKLITSAKAAVKGPYVAEAYANKAEWLFTDLTIKLSDVITKAATAAFDVQAGGSSTQLASIDLYVADSIEECGLTEKWNTAKDQAVTATDLAERIQEQADSVPWYPKGFREFSPGLATKWVDNPNVDCYSCTYWQLDIVTLDGCPNGLYAEMNILNSNGTVIDWTNDSLPLLSVGDKARLTFETYNDASAKGSLATLQCS